MWSNALCMCILLITIAIKAISDVVLNIYAECWLVISWGLYIQTIEVNVNTMLVSHKVV